MRVHHSNTILLEGAMSDDESTIRDSLIIQKDITVIYTKTIDDVQCIFIKKKKYGEVKYGDMFLHISNENIDTYAHLISGMTYPEVILLMRQI